MGVLFVCRSVYRSSMNAKIQMRKFGPSGSLHYSCVHHLCVSFVVCSVFPVRFCAFNLCFVVQRLSLSCIVESQQNKSFDGRTRDWCVRQTRSFAIMRVNVQIITWPRFACTRRMKQAIWTKVWASALFGSSSPLCLALLQISCFVCKQCCVVVCWVAHGQRKTSAPVQNVELPTLAYPH